MEFIDLAAGDFNLSLSQLPQTFSITSILDAYYYRLLVECFGSIFTHLNMTCVSKLHKVVTSGSS